MALLGCARVWEYKLSWSLGGQKVHPSLRSHFLLARYRLINRSRGSYIAQSCPTYTRNGVPRLMNPRLAPSVFARALKSASS